MSDLRATEALPVPPPSRRGAPPWGRVGVALLAAAVGVLGAALASDAAGDDGGEAVAPSGTARPVPVLAPIDGSALSSAVAEHALAAWSSDTRGFVLASWGAAFSDLLGPGGEGVPPDQPDATLDEDPRLTEPGAGPGFVDPCAGEDPGDAVPEGCADGEPASVLEEGSVPANAAAVVAFPHPDVAIAAECPFDDVTGDELPLAVITANPGHVVVRIGAEQVEVDSTAEEVAEWEAWLADGEGPRPPATFVAHCIAVPTPAGDDPVAIRAIATDEAGQEATAETVLAPVDDALPPPTLTPVDDTLVRIDVPVADGDDAPEVTTRRVADFGPFPPACAGDAPAASGWRIGTTATAQVAAPAGERPYLEAAPAVHRVTTPLPEGEASIVCITRPGATGPSTTGFLVTPPDARRLRLAVTELALTDPVAAEDVQVRGTFAELAWTPCGAGLPAAAAEAGTSDPGVDGVLCTSGGDTGAIAAAGGAIDLTVRVGPAIHRARIGLSASPGGSASASYRLPIPAPDLVGELCTDGVDQPGCTPPEGDAVLGSVVVTASWDEGPIGPAAWSIEPLAGS